LRPEQFGTNGVVSGVLARPYGEVSIGYTGSSAQRRLTNLAAGAVDTDAANISQLKAVRASVVGYDKNAGGWLDYSNVTLAGTNGTKITNVAPGSITSTSTDAINGAQLYNVSSALNDNSTLRFFKADGAADGTDDATAVSGTRGVAAGAKARASTGGVALGYNASANATNSVALGANSVAKTGAQTSYAAYGLPAAQSSSGEVAVGNRTISGVAAGYVNTDAVNVAQLKGATSGVVKYATNTDGSPNYNSVTLAGASGTKITNVASGDVSSNSTDAINGAQLFSATSNVKQPYFKADGHNDGFDDAFVTPGYFGVAVGADARAIGWNAVALGPGSLAQGSFSSALGWNAFSYGENSTAVGPFAVAGGPGSVALGGAYVIGYATDSIAIGTNARALTADSIAIGAFSTATPNAWLSQAIGYNATVDANFSVALGTGARANAESSMALGYGANVASDASRGVAIGNSATVTAANSVALGANSIAKAGAQSNYSAYGLTDRQTSSGEVAIGNRTISGVAPGSTDTDAVSVAQLKGATSGAVKYATNANGSANYNSVELVGANGTKITNVAAGDVSAKSTDAINGAQLYAATSNVKQPYFKADGLNDGTDDASVTAGTNALATGASARASGAGAVATGYQATASASNALAVGSDTTASGVNGIAVGNAAQATGTNAVALGAGARASQNAIALGRVSTANGANSSALGYGSLAYSDGSTALGASAKVSGTNSLALGYNASVTAANSVGLGANSTTTANLKQAAQQFGTSGIVQAIQAVGEVSVGSAGNERRVTNVAAGAADTDAVNVSQLKGVSQQISAIDSSDTMRYFKADGPQDGTGDAAVTQGTYAVAAGANANASGHDSVAFGFNASASALNSAAFGANSAASASNSLAVGADSGAFAVNSVALGAGSVANRANTVSVGAAGKERQITNVAAGTATTDAVNVGQLNAALSSVVSTAMRTVGVVQESASADSAVAASTVSQTAAVNTSDTADTTQMTRAMASVNNVGAVADTTFFSAQGDASTEAAVASATHALASGANAQASGTNAVAVGANSAATGSSATALGTGATASADHAVALGDSSVADRANTVSVGAAGQERQVVNVAPGVQGTDAVNMNQLSQSMSGAVQQSQSYTDNKVHGARRDAFAGTAAAMAVAALPQAFMPGRGMVAVAGGTYHGEASVALGISKVSETGKWVYKGQATTDSRGGFGASLGAGMHF
jgi:autotransporter adhesin